MSRDPAFLFYDGDAARDVSHMNRLERGCYFDLIQAQRKFGKMRVEFIKKILGKDFDICWGALEIVLKQEDSLFFIDWLLESSLKREKHSIHQRENANKRWHKKVIPTQCHGNANAMPLENENENENENVNVNEVINENRKAVINNIIFDFNLVSGSKYKTTSKKTNDLIKARLNDGFNEEDFKCVHRKMVKTWGSDEKMCKYLRPETLYGTKFESYLNMKEPTTKLTQEGVKAFFIGSEWLKKEIEKDA